MTLTVSAHTSGAAPLQYQWKRNGVPIPGATNASLTLQNTQPEDCGAFTAQVSDGLDSVESVPTKVIPSFLNSLLGTEITLLNLTLGQIRSLNVGVINTNPIPALLPGVRAAHPVIFHWKPLLSGTVTFSTAGSDFDTVLGAYTVSGATNYTRVPTAVNDDDSGGYLASTLSFNAVGNTDYSIIVDGYRGAVGDLVLNWSEALTNILHPQSYPKITAMPPQVTTIAPGAPLNLTGQWENEDCVWLFDDQATAVVNTNAFILASASESAIGFYAAAVNGHGGLKAVTQPAAVEFNVLQDGSTAADSFAFRKFLDAANAPFAQPVPHLQHVRNGGGDTRGYSSSQTFSTAGAGQEPGEPSICGQIGGNSAWYAYVAPTSGSLLIDTTGSSFNTMLGVYSGPGNSFATLTNEGCGFTTNFILNGQPAVYVAHVVAGQTNYIQVDGYRGASGVVHLNVHLGAPVSIFLPPSDQVAVAGGAATFSAAASGATNLTYFWLFNGARISGARA